jgi:hypothetical protein
VPTEAEVAGFEGAAAVADFAAAVAEAALAAALCAFVAVTTGIFCCAAASSAPRSRVFFVGSTALETFAVVAGVIRAAALGAAVACPPAPAAGVACPAHDWDDPVATAATTSSARIIEVNVGMAFNAAQTTSVRCSNPAAVA